jgi:hypothetical protein
MQKRAPAGFSAEHAEQRAIGVTQYRGMIANIHTSITYMSELVEVSRPASLGHLRQNLGGDQSHVVEVVQVDDLKV